MAEIRIKWPKMKAFIDSTKLPYKYVDDDERYHIWVHDGGVTLYCRVRSDDADHPNTIDFVDNYKSGANTVINDQSTLKCAKAKGATNGTGYVKLSFKVPGTPGSGDGRYVDNGTGWFENTAVHSDDEVMISVVDEDNLLGYGAGTVVDTYYDTEVPTDEQGWYISEHNPILRVSSVSHGAFVPSGLYIIVEAQTGDERTDTFRCNMKWGKRV